LWIFEQIIMRFTEKHIRWGATRFTAKKDGFIFNLYHNKDNTWHCSVNHTKKDIRFNSLWQGIKFSSREDAEKWCDGFKPNNFNCLGEDFNK